MKSDISGLKSTKSSVSASRGDTRVAAKIARLQNGERPRVLDLFSGCGGFSLGFSAAGYEIIGGVEIDPEAAVTHAMNFHNVEPPESKAKCSSFARDIRTLDPAELIKQLTDRHSSAKEIDVLIGGPPCQSFARVGRPKLREVHDHPEAYRIDPRGNLYLRYLDYVRSLQPLIIVMENVPDSLNYGGHNVAEETAETLDGMGYACRYTLLNSVYYGVPQMRERMFLIAYHRALHSCPSFPKPTHYYDLPRGYHGARRVALRHHNGGRGSLCNGFKYYVDPPVPSSDLPSAVTAEMAIQDLPPITHHLERQFKRGVRQKPEPVAYMPGKYSKFIEQMRNWPGANGSGYVSDHIIRHLPRDYRIFRRMKPGDQYPQAHKIAMRLFGQALSSARARGVNARKGSRVYRDLLSKYVPPYDPNKFPNKWRKIEADQPARTVMAHLGKDSYSHIHYDSEQARTISVREAARLQSFPDGFTFYGAMNASFRQIGNAVPPLMAYAVANQINKDMALAIGYAGMIAAASGLR